jgi:glycosyltransferase involved in cell wall biosynthesis
MGMETIIQRKISVVVPTCDRPALLREALASIRALEGPDMIFEILIGDNGHAPETPALAEEFGAIYLKVSKRGPSAARNVGLWAATGEFLAFLDDDDVWLPGNLRPHLALLDSHPTLDAVIGQVIYTDQYLAPNSLPWPTDAPGDGKQMLKRILSALFPQLGTTLARTSVRERFGEFDETLTNAEDWDWFLRIARRHKLGYVEVPCIFFRGRPPGTSDELQRKRISDTRRVFFRHSLPEWQLWKSPLDFLRAYASTLKHHYRYFVDAAVGRSESGKRLEALRAISTALRISPLRGAYHLIARRPLRKALWASIAWHQKSRRPKPWLSN